MKRPSTCGFTLIEVIVAIVLSAIAMAAILPFLGSVFQLSHEPRTTLQSALSLQSAMERLVAWDMAHTNNPELLRAYVSSHGGTFEGQEVVINQYVAYVNGVETFGTVSTNLLKLSLRSPETQETVERLFAVPP